MAAEKKKVMDIQKPGSSAASKTSRPIIASRGGLIKDPAIKDTETKPDQDDEVTTSSRKVIAPLSDDDKPKDDTKDASNDADDAKEEPAVDAEKDEKAAESVSDASEPSSEPSDTAAVDALAEQAGAKKETKESEMERKRQEAVTKLIEEKKYVVPISYTKSSKKLFGIVIGVVVLLLGAGFYAAADAGFIGSGDMPIDFIANNKATDKQSDSVEADPANAEPVSGRTPSDSTPVDNPDQPVSSSINEADEERLTDIKAIHGQLEMYYAKNKRYPTLAEINDASFRSQHLLGMVDEALKDPEGSEARLVAEPGAKAYAYEATTMSGEQCDNATAVCLQYTLTATLSDGKKQTHKQLD